MADDDKQTDRTADKINSLEKLVKYPDDLACDVVKKWAENREYVHTVAQIKDSDDTVVTNYILRALQAAVEASTLNRPAVSFTPGGYIPEQDHPDPSIQQLAMQDGNPFNRYPEGWSTYTKTQEILLTKQAEQGGLYEALVDANLERRFASISFIKVRWIEDDSSDPLGAPLPTDQARARRYIALHEAYEAGDIEEDTDSYFELVELSDQFKEERKREIDASLFEQPAEAPTDLLGNPLPGGLDPRLEELNSLDGDGLFDPELLMLAPTYQGPAFEVIDPEDVRFDWSISRRSGFRNLPWIAHRSPMLPEDIREIWGAEWDEEEANEYLGSTHSANRTGDSDRSLNSEDIDPKYRDDDLEGSHVGKRIYVWEYWDLVTRKRYRWVQGAKRFLDTIELRDMPKRIHPFFPLFSNPVSGRIFGPPDVQLGIPIQEEINKMSTHDLQARKSAYPKYIIDKGCLSEDEKALLASAAPYAVIETVRPAEDVKKKIHEIFSGNYNPALYETSRLMAAMEIQMGIAASRMGATGSAKFATTEAIANQGFGDRTNSMQADQVKLLGEIFTYVSQLNVRKMTEDVVKTIVGPGAYWPVEQLSHEQILANYMVRVRVAPNEDQKKQQEMSRLQMLAGIVQQMGLPMSRIWFMNRLADVLDASEERENIIDVALLLDMMQQPAPAGGGESGSAPEPEDQGPRGDEGGRPDMQEQEPAITPETIPNNRTPQE